MAAKRFKAVLEILHDGLGWTIARVPFEPSVWKTMVRLRVKGTIGSSNAKGFGFRTSLFPDARGGYFLLVNKGMQRGGDVRLGQVAEFTLEPDLEAREAELPDELAVLLDDEPGLREWYDELSEYARREMGKWILATKSDESRMRRAEQTAERLLAAMEGEKELPPVIAAAFRRRPKAKAGWEKMTVAQRRGELMAVFHYLSPESREKRVGKLCDAAEKRVGWLARSQGVLNGCAQRNEIVLNGLPDEFVIEAVVLVANHVADSPDCSPFRAGANCLNIRTEPDCCFANDEDLAFYGRARLEVINVSVEAYSFCKGADVVDGGDHV